MATVSPFISALGENAIWRSRVLGARNAITNWPIETYVESDIKIRMDEISTREHDTAGGRVTEKRAKLFTLADVRAMDQIVYHNETWEVESNPTPIYLLNNIAFYRVIVIAVIGMLTYWGFEYMVLGFVGFDIPFERSIYPI